MVFYYLVFKRLLTSANISKYEQFKLKNTKKDVSGVQNPSLCYNGTLEGTFITFLKEILH